MSIKATPTRSLKDDLFNRASVTDLATAIRAACPDFNHTTFIRRSLEAFAELELKARIDHLVDVLTRLLPDDFTTATRILESALPPPLDPSRVDDDFGQYHWIVPGEFVARHGCTSARRGRSLRFLRESTKRFSAENAIRPFLQHFPDQTLAFLRECATDANYHVRRLATEGTRPLLPWSMRVDLPVASTLALLDLLHADPTRYVTRSVANHLNDISKSQPDIVIDRIRQWHASGLQQRAELDWITRHALRSLIRADHPQALELLGYPSTTAVKVSGLVLTKSVKVGQSLEVSFDLLSQTDQKLLVAMRIYYRKANGKQAPKLFRLKDVKANKGQKIPVSKRQPFRPMTTRTLYPGEHRLEVVVNGQVKARGAFEVTT